MLKLVAIQYAACIHFLGCSVTADLLCWLLLLLLCRLKTAINQPDLV
jgi:hypothetical protein